MRVLLLTAKKVPRKESPLSYGDIRPPLGLGFIAAVLETHGHEVLIVDNYLYPQDTTQIIEEFKPHYIGLYTHSAGFRAALNLIDEIKREYRKIPLICGGPHATLMPETIPENVEHIVIGEGEFALLDIVEGKERNRIIKKKRIEDLDTLPWPSYHHFIDKPYDWKIEMFGMEGPVFVMNTSRGCPFQCKFCSVRTIWGKEYRFFSASKIVDEIERLILKYGAKGIYFREDNFTANRRRLLNFCNLLKERRIKVVWACETRVDTIDNYKILQQMVEVGCRGFYIGVESGSQRVLDNMNKGTTVGQIKSVFKMCHELGIKTYASMCYGTPGETEEDREITEELLDKIRPDRISRAVFVGIPKSEFYQYLLENELYYHIDKNGFLYPKGYYELATRYYRGEDRYIPIEEITC
jgi:radical SAM superfamily enzyme YgiQ (UPF0313 family)